MRERRKWGQVQQSGQLNRGTIVDGGSMTYYPSPGR